MAKKKAARRKTVARSKVKIFKIANRRGYAAIVAGKLDEVQRLRLPPHETLERRTELCLLPSQVDNGAVDKLDHGWLEFDKMLGGLHSREECREMANAEDLVLRNRCELEVDLLEPCERAFGTDENVGKIAIFAAEPV